MSANRHWTEDEDKVLLSQVKRSPENLKLAFAAAAIELGRSEGACGNRWYTNLSRREDKSHSIFYCISKKSIGRNRKNCKTILTSTEKRGFWRSILTKLFK